MSAAIMGRALRGGPGIVFAILACAAQAAEPSSAPWPAWLEQEEVPAAAPAAQSGQDLPDVEMYVGETQVFPAPGVARVAVGNGRVINAATADDREVVVFANAAGTSSLVIWDGDGAMRRMRITVVPGQSSRVQREIEAFLATIPSVRSRLVGDKIIVEGDDLSDADQARIALLARRYPQVVDFTGQLGWERMVMMDVKVVEMPRSRLRELGVRWDGASTGGLNAGLAWDAAVGRPLRAAAGDAAQRPGGGPIELPFPATSPAGYLGMNALLSARIQAMAQSGEAVILAQPQLSARSGSTARFLAGGEVPYATVDRNGASNTTFKPYGVTLQIAPRVDAGGTVRSVIDVEVSAVDPSVTATGGPALKVRRTATEFNVRSGETLVLSGFLSREQSQDLDGLPGLSSLPILGPLFGSRRFQRRETELAIFVTPTVVTQRNPDLRERIDRGQRVLDETFGPERLNVPVRPDAPFLER
ncbi:pilus assembly protein N-terminal domain-containing protein [Pigmentiphaga sp. GD03639]|uniref:type II and III secretion system protein family protein n=1 Tax=unclassified Pigmentiphaga TaxID=2626614 RepID=UPI001FB754DD|nr:MULTISPECIES: pilus assembly protein N-terminal domain-containing protein [unclassified Pigmentiphaga]MDH2239034.1 pilus assembly protein N-terminal domain-containing protein [Pigmentiphaga sp. GD03639]